MILAPLAAALVQMAISRTREYAADRAGAEISGNPLALASALERIAMGAARIDNDVAERNPATAHMFIINPLHAHKRDALFATHPATENRIAALRQMAQDMPRPSSGPAPNPARPAPTPASAAAPWGQAPRKDRHGKDRGPRGPWG